MMKDSNAALDRVTQLVAVAAEKFSTSKKVTAFLHDGVDEFNGSSPTHMALQSADGFIKALIYLNGLNLK